TSISSPVPTSHRVLTAALTPESARQYRGAARHFLIYLGEDLSCRLFVKSVCHDSHILGWFVHLRSRTPPLAPAVYVCHLLFLRSILEELAWTAQLPRSCPSDPPQGHSEHSTTFVAPADGRRID